MRALLVALAACAGASDFPLPRALRAQLDALRTRLTSAAAPGCFERHIQDALAVNRERLPRYSAATAGESERVSRRLIDLERLSILPARWFDWRSREWRDQGVPLLCDEFAPMTGIAEFKTGVIPPAPRDVAGWDASAAGRELRGLGGGCRTPECFQGLGRRLDERLGSFADQPDYYCMTRHVLESLGRAAALAPSHDAAARARGLASTYALSREFIGSQTLVLGQAWELDAWARPLQQRGVPILCRDLPPIPR